MSQATKQIPDPVQALHGDCLRYPGGITALALKIGRSPGHLHNKFADSMPAYDITDHEADALASMVREKIGANAYIQSKCALHGGIFVLWPETGEAGDEDVLHALLTSMHDLGEMAQEVAVAKADGIVSPKEFAGIEQSSRKLIGQIHAFIQVLRTQVREITPPATLAVAPISGIQLCGGEKK
jgi:hypothetical protein